MRTRQAELRRLRARLLEQPRLPDPGGALDDQRPAGPLPDGAQRGADALDLVLALEQRGRPGEGGLGPCADRSYAPGALRRAMFGGRCQGMLPDVRRRRSERTMAAMATPQEDSMPLIQVKVIAGVFTAPQKQEIIERLTDAMVAIEGENMRRPLVHRRGGRQRRVGHRRPGRSPPTTSRRSRAEGDSAN